MKSKQDVMVEFFGGPMDGKVLSTDADPTLDSNKAAWLCAVGASGMSPGTRQREPVATSLIWRVTRDQLAKYGVDTVAPRFSNLDHYDYAVTSYEANDEILILKAEFQVAAPRA